MSGALVAPFSQAVPSLLLQLVALRALGAETFGTYALIYSGILLATAITAGLVGDSLTVLERGQPAIRAGLFLVSICSVAVTGVVAAAVAAATGTLSGPVAVVLGVAIALFIVEDLTRRMQIALLRFWRVVLIDVAVLACTVAWLVVVQVVGATLTIGHLLLAVVVAQAGGAAAGYLLLPTAERWLAPMRDADVPSVLRFGRWRAVQQAIRPGSLVAFRMVAVVAAGAALFGELEAARVYASPAVLLGNGAAGFHLASYSIRKGHALSRLVRRADISAVLMALAIAAVGVVAVLAAPLADGFLTGGAFDLNRVAIVGWLSYAAVTAGVSPYASLGTTRGLHVTVVGLRAADAVLSIATVVVLIVIADRSIAWAPFGLCVGPLATMFILRRRVRRLETGRPV